MRSSTKGVTEGSETAIGWDATYSTRTGTVTRIDESRVTVRRDRDGHLHTWVNAKRLPLAVRVGDAVSPHQVLASAVLPRSEEQLACPGELPAGHIEALLRSPERTQRFTGVKLARLRRAVQFTDTIAVLGAHPDEDIYVKLEAAAYLVSVSGQSAEATFRRYLEHAEDQVRLEAVVALAETGSNDAGRVLAAVLDEQGAAYFLRSAAAWGLGRIGSEEAAARLIAAFADVNDSIREEALEAVAMLGMGPLPRLLGEVFSEELSIAAGAAEAIRRLETVPHDSVSHIIERIRSGDRAEWATWLLGSLPHPDYRTHEAITRLKEERPAVHFAVTVLASFMESWIARSWEAFPRPQDFHADEGLADD